jgi:hypothetical protein
MHKIEGEVAGAMQLHYVSTLALKWGLILQSLVSSASTNSRRIPMWLRSDAVLPRSKLRFLTPNHAT